MNRKIVVHAIIGALALAGLVRAGDTLPEPCTQSSLCRGLGEVYEFEEVSDSTRFGKFMGQLYEPVGGGQDVGRDTTNFKTGAASLDLTGVSTSYLWSNSSGSPTGLHTIGFWFRPNTLPGEGVNVTIASWDASGVNNYGSSILMNTTGGITKVGYSAYNFDGAATTAYSSQALSANTWYYVTVGFGNVVDANGAYIGRQINALVNGANSGTATLGFEVSSGTYSFRLGGRPYNGPAASIVQPVDAQIDQFAIWGRELNGSEITWLSNSGSGRAYPFVSE